MDPAPANAPAPSPPQRTLGQRVLRATVSIAIAHSIAKILGVVQASMMAEQFGIKSPTADAYVIAFESIIWMLFLVGEESLGPAFLPVFMEAKEKEGEDAAWKFTSTLMNYQFMLLLGVTTLLWMYPEASVKLLLSFRSEGSETAVVEGVENSTTLAIHFLKGMSPALIGLSFGSLTYMVLNGYKQFFWPAFADAGIKMSMVAGIFFGTRAGWSSDSLVLGVLIGGAVKISVHLFALRGKLKFYRPTFSLSDPYVRRFTGLVLPLLAGIIFAKIRDNWNNVTVLSYLNEPGLMGVNSFGKKIYSTIGFIVPYPLSLAMFPFLCELVERNDREAMGAFLTKASRMLVLIFLPFAAIVCVLSIPLAETLYLKGKVKPEDAILAGKVSACYSAVIPFWALEMVYIQAYFSSRRVWSITAIGITCSMLSMVASYVGLHNLNYKGADAVMWVALCFTASRAVKAGAMATILKLHLPMLPLGPTLWFALRTLVLAAACAGTTWIVLDYLNQHGMGSGVGLKQNLPRLIAPSLAAGVVFVAGCFILRLEEAREMFDLAKEKLNRKKSKAPPA